MAEMNPVARENPAARPARGFAMARSAGRGAILWWWAALAAAAPGQLLMEAPPAVPLEPLRTLRARARPLAEAADLDPLIERAAAARLVLLGEATHGTAEFYSWRDRISRRLIAEHDFRFIAVEGDWAACYRLNRYVKDLPGAADDARSVMEGFTRWPTWMWANEETLALIEWLRAFNRDRPMDRRVGFYGIDVYGDDRAREKVLMKLAAFDAELAAEARAAYQPFERFAGDTTGYAHALAAGAPPLDRNAQTVLDLIEHQAGRLREEDPRAWFHAWQSALVTRSAERHVRAMLAPGPVSWNARVEHFHGTAERLLEFYGPDARGIVWAHNTHVGDARATGMGGSGHRNIGQLARESLGADRVFSVGFGAYRGWVQAGRAWGAPRERMPVPPGRPGSYEDWMHRLGMPAALFVFEPATDRAALSAFLPHRAIGVVYQPERDREANYVPTRLAHRYDAFLFFADTEALAPIEAGKGSSP